MLDHNTFFKQKIYFKKENARCSPGLKWILFSKIHVRKIWGQFLFTFLKNNIHLVLGVETEGGGTGVGHGPLKIREKTNYK
jgi:hypothetical protein